MRRPGPPPPEEPGGPLLTSRGTVLLTVMAAWTAVPSVVASPKLNWLITLLLLALVANALWWHGARLRPSGPVALVAVLLLCGTLSVAHFGTLADLATAASAALLLLGCAVLAASAGPADVRRFSRGVMAIAVVQLVAATASALLGTPAPWGYLGAAGSTFEVNQLLPELGGRATGTMAHPIPFGTLMAVSVLLALSPVLRWPLTLRLLAAAGGAFGVVLSGSRSAALALLVAVFVAALVPGALRVQPVARTVVLLGAVVALLTVEVGSLRVVTSLQGTGSLTHRLGALDAAERLAERPLAQTLLGSGTGSLRDLFDAGLLQLDGFFAVDNQFVATFATAGLVGALALIGLVAAGLLHGHRATRPAALLMVAMFLSFDVLEWTATAVLTVVLLTLGTGRGLPEQDAARPSTGAAPIAPDQAVLR
ncbi:hypothetical protein JD78_00041 [Modestobacter roseus]|uniref:O-antigen ligase-related domain-containing protein n=1 Tax=Modestobacter roseus TaxID=1181884 RepID=A0A562ILR6_9ACTN|nr:hypothetical protein JD78_00041 [Modestobacter roseus]